MNKVLPSFLIICLTMFSIDSSRMHGHGKRKKHKINRYQNYQKEDSVSTIDNSTLNIKSPDSIFRFAICLTGQLVRLELGSKILNLINTNLEKGFKISLFILLDNELDNVKAVKHIDRFKSENALYRNSSSEDLEKLIVHGISPNVNSSNFKVRVRLEPPIQNKYTLTSIDTVPVSAPYDISDRDKKLKKSQFDRAFDRFQSHMRWQAGLRECMKWVQEIEILERNIFDFVMR